MKFSRIKITVIAVILGFFTVFATALPAQAYVGSASGYNQGDLGIGVQRVHPTSVAYDAIIRPHSWLLSDQIINFYQGPTNTGACLWTHEVYPVNRGWVFTYTPAHKAAWVSTGIYPNRKYSVIWLPRNTIYNACDGPTYVPIGPGTE